MEYTLPRKNPNPIWLSCMLRSLVLKVSFVAIVLHTLPMGLSAVENPNSKPNIIFILTDDQGYGDLGRHGHPILKTPNLDRLFDESVRFDNFYVSPSCAPTRAALMTGMHEFRNGVTHTMTPRYELFTGTVILPELLKTAGYSTGLLANGTSGEVRINNLKTGVSIGLQKALEVL